MRRMLTAVVFLALALTGVLIYRRQRQATYASPQGKRRAA
jgi:hypothetical protein